MDQRRDPLPLQTSGACNSEHQNKVSWLPVQETQQGSVQPTFSPLASAVLTGYAMLSSYIDQLISIQLQSLAFPAYKASV